MFSFYPKSLDCASTRHTKLLSAALLVQIELPEVLGARQYHTSTRLYADIERVPQVTPNMQNSQVGTLRNQRQ